MAAVHSQDEELLDVLTKSGEKTGVSKPRGLVHRDGDYHRAVHVWIYSESTQELLLQRRADCKDSWPGLWDISSAGHISAGDSSLLTARRELDEELGISLPEDAFELVFVFLQECVINNGKYINNEFNDVYLVTTLAPIPLEAFVLQETEVSSVKYIHWTDYRSLLANDDQEYVPYDVNGQYGQLFNVIQQRCKEDVEARSLILQKQLSRYAPIHLDAEISGLSEADKKTLFFLIKAAKVIDDIFYAQVWRCNPMLRDWLKKNSDASNLDKLKWMYFSINKSPWSCLDEDKAFLTTADSAIRLLAKSTRTNSGWKGIEYRTAFPMLKPPGANFYPSDMDKKEFDLWKGSLGDSEQERATGFFSVIKRYDESAMDYTLCTITSDATNHAEFGRPTRLGDLYAVPYSQEYSSFLVEAAEFLKKAAEVTESSSLKKLLMTKADAFLSNDYYESDIAWMELKLLPERLLKSMYVSFLAGCFRSIRFGLEEAHGKGQALQFNWLFEKGAFICHSDGTFSVDFTKVEKAVESLSREILTIQAEGNKSAAKCLLHEHAKISKPLSAALEKLASVQVPVDIAPIFNVTEKISSVLG